MNPLERVVVLGTGTGIGKTHLGVALLHVLARAGHNVVGLKPVESGVGLGISDTERLRGASTFHVKHPPPYALQAPVSPHLAARQEGLTLHLDTIVRWVAQCAATCTLVETAGALLSPLAPRLTNLDLTLALEPSAVVLVAPDRLGVLHDVTATLLAYRTLAPHLPEPVVALLPPPEPDASTGHNAAELRALDIAQSVIPFPRAQATAPNMLACATALAHALHPAPQH